MSEMDAPDASGAPPPTPPSSNWSAPPPAAAAAAVPGAAGFVYADVPNRVIALIIDAVILGIVNLVILGAILSTVGLAVVTTTGVNVLALIVYAILGSIISLVYFVFTWTRMRASPGLKVLGMQVGNAADGATLTQDQAIKRWLALWGPGTLGQLLANFPGIGPLLGLLGLGWMIYLLYTTYQSPTKQGFHDKYASTVVVKAATTVG